MDEIEAYRNHIERRRGKRRTSDKAIQYKVAKFWDVSLTLYSLFILFLIVCSYYTN